MGFVHYNFSLLFLTQCQILQQKQIQARIPTFMGVCYREVSQQACCLLCAIIDGFSSMIDFINYDRYMYKCTYMYVFGLKKNLIACSDVFIAVL